MKDLKKVKYLILDMDGCVYHPKYLKTQISTSTAPFDDCWLFLQGTDAQV